MGEVDYKQILQNLKAEDKISQGAEAIMYKIATQKGTVLVKHRFPKSYREPTLDKSMNKRRVNNENRMLQRFSELNVPCPKVLFCNQLDIVMEYIDGVTLKRFLTQHYVDGKYTPDALKAMHALGRLIGTIHKNGFIHGDLTTSNFMVNTTGDMVVIDFGLTTKSETTENRAVDLYVLERAILCTHYNADVIFKSILEGYTETANNSAEILRHLDEVRLRGRKKDMTG
ncbi:TP53-regulating kinase, putative [Entamoeba invadens IP1]|uniref:non-specific serine/threonine protein kinase n=1 Tax=Entamoeba invadens IP1 TaxID=370355 RepID=A0A0A1U325_ENTIV|nr:TP53-regulating kinase, putative [Entamoeba invadens IP1]ELP88461.1 TP53-regulating kinase, putative [Entamoeba invadens IP1]|eukprot:XP_004255232.1 TP53-regulating kinase, putative [Entamoeba invadens IP1]